MPDLPHPDLPPELADAWEACLSGAGDDAGAQALLAWIEAHPEALPALRAEAALNAALSCLLSTDDHGTSLRDAVMARLGDPPSATASGPFAAHVMGKVRRRPPRRARRADSWRWMPVAAAALVLLAVGGYVVAPLVSKKVDTERPAQVAKPAPTPSSPTRDAYAQVSAHGGVTIDGVAVPPDRSANAPVGAAIVVADGGRADLRLPDGTAFALGADSRLVLAAAGSREHRLEHGGIEVEAAPQPADHPLAIATPRATATVVGTIFRVEADAERTWVRVARGRVGVSAGARSAMLDRGNEVIADAGGLGAVLDPARRRLLDIGTVLVNPQFGRAVLGAEGAPFHGLAVRSVAYAADPARPDLFADLYWPATLADDEVRFEAWARPTRSTPFPGLATTTVAIVATCAECDYLVGQTEVRPDDRGWLRVTGALANAQLNWVRPGIKPPSATPRNVTGLQLRVLHGGMDGELTGIAIVR